jgi:hypothetical protein
MNGRKKKLNVKYKIQYKNEYIIKRNLKEKQMKKKKRKLHWMREKQAIILCFELNLLV